MGCLSVRVTREGGSPEVGIERLGMRPSVLASRAGGGMQVSCRLVCEVGRNLFLSVSPDFVWLVGDSVEFFDVASNTNWNVE